jgi:hypothetical protein
VFLTALFEQSLHAARNTLVWQNPLNILHHLALGIGRVDRDVIQCLELDGEQCLVLFPFPLRIKSSGGSPWINGGAVLESVGEEVDFVKNETYNGSSSDHVKSSRNAKSVLADEVSDGEANRDLMTPSSAFLRSGFDADIRNE